MPFYNYKCDKCGSQVEIYKLMSKRNGEERCPECKAKMRRLLSAPAVHFKGSGWYVTDYKKPSTPKKDKDE